MSELTETETRVACIDKLLNEMDMNLQRVSGSIM
jgi:hypothetical protein